MSLLANFFFLKKAPALLEESRAEERERKRGREHGRERERVRASERARETGRNTTYLLLLQMQQLDCAYFAARVTSA